MHNYRYGALLHMMCHELLIFKDRGTTAGQVAMWLKISKPTALEMLNKLITDKMVYRVTEQYRPNAKIFIHYPTRDTWEKFEEGMFVGSYNTHMQYIVKPYQTMFKEWSKGDLK